MKQTGFLSKAAVLVFVVVSLLLATGTRDGCAADTIKIGHICSVTGWAGMLGTPQRDALLAVVEDINKKGGLLGKQVEAFIEDDQSNPTTASIAATKLIKDTKVSVLIGTTISDSGMAVSPIAERERIPFFLTTPVVLPWDRLKWTFAIGPGDEKMAVHVLELAVKQLGAQHIALLHDTTLYGNSGAKIFNAEIGKYPGTSIIMEEKYEVQDTSMVPQLTKIKAAKPDLLVIYGTGAPAAVVAKNYKQLGMTVPVLGAGGLGGPDFLKLAGNIADEGNWAIAVLKISIAEKLPFSDPYRKNVYEPAKKIFQDKYGKDKGGLNVFHVSPMDAFTMATMGMKAAGTDDRAKLREALEKVRFTALLGGRVIPQPDNHIRDCEDSSELALFKNGEFVPYAK
ncbi:MAG TPA: ABC transporter substrate-binding protein [Syntrophorhabdales bacterium]|nr:ABC transporter substrate-binding protein [Syntrophorhabdales bacterium]